MLLFGGLVVWREGRTAAAACKETRAPAPRKQLICLQRYEEVRKKARMEAGFRVFSAIKANSGKEEAAKRRAAGGTEGEGGGALKTQHTGRKGREDGALQRNIRDGRGGGGCFDNATYGTAGEGKLEGKGERKAGGSLEEQGERPRKTLTRFFLSPRRINRRSTASQSTLHVKLANSPRSVAFSSVLSCPSFHVLFSPFLCMV